MRALLHLDSLIHAFVVSHRVRALDPLMWLLSAAGRGGALMLVIGAALALGRRLSRTGFIALVLAVLVATLLANDILKPVFHRARPWVSDTTFLVIGGRPDSASFPSGHAATAFAGALVLARGASAPAWPWWTLAAGVAFSRIYLGVHYPLDVIAGAIVGLASAALIVTVLRIDRATSSSPPHRHG